MNRYGQMALNHWKRWLPQTLAAIPDRESFFTRLGLDVERQIDELSDRLAGPDRPGETYLDKLGRLRAAKITAESEILRAEVLLPPENDPDEETPAQHGPWTSVTEDPTDPVWQQDLAYPSETDQP